MSNYFPETPLDNFSEATRKYYYQMIKCARLGLIHYQKTWNFVNNNAFGAENAWFGLDPIRSHANYCSPTCFYAKVEASFFIQV